MVLFTQGLHVPCSTIIPNGLRLLNQSRHPLTLLHDVSAIDFKTSTTCPVNIFVVLAKLFSNIFAYVMNIYSNEISRSLVINVSLI